MQIALFITCFNGTLFPEVGQATVAVLERVHTVDFPEARTCCGQRRSNTGYQREALPLVRHFVEVFGGAQVLIAPSASFSVLPVVGAICPLRTCARGQSATKARDIRNETRDFGVFPIPKAKTRRCVLHDSHPERSSRC
jgi:hypothetical protein